jgi:head-tail adaptor
MAIGELRHRVTLENPTIVPDSEGGFTETWNVLGIARLPASVMPATPRDLERQTSGTVTATASHLVTLRYLAGVTTKTRVRFHDTTDRVLAVEGIVDREERHRMLILACTEAVS